MRGLNAGLACSMDLYNLYILYSIEVSARGLSGSVLGGVRNWRSEMFFFGGRGLIWSEMVIRHGKVNSAIGGIDANEDAKDMKELEELGASSRPSQKP